MQTKEWDWSKNTDDKWLIPSVESAYLSERWSQLGFKDLFDLGCGLGRHSLYFAAKGFKVTAADLSEYAVEAVKIAAAKAQIVITALQCNMLNLPFADASFDCLMAYNVIYHTDTDGFLHTLAELERVLKPGGELYITLISKNTWSFVNADKFKRIDDNTILRDEDETEKNVPHFFVDINDIYHYFNRFDIVKTPIEETEYDKERPEYYSRHFTVLARKR